MSGGFAEPAIWTRWAAQCLRPPYKSTKQQIHKSRSCRGHPQHEGDSLAKKMVGTTRPTQTNSVPSGVKSGDSDHGQRTKQHLRNHMRTASRAEVFLEEGGGLLGRFDGHGLGLDGSLHYTRGAVKCARADSNSQRLNCNQAVIASPRMPESPSLPSRITVPETLTSKRSSSSW